MRGIVLIGAAAISLVSCRQEPLRPVAAPPASEALCDAGKVQDVIGKRSSAVLAEDARVRSGAKLVRTLLPDMMVTMEYRGDRLNLTVGTDGLIGSVNCG